MSHEHGRTVSRRRLAWILGVAVSVAFIPMGILNLGFVRDDWNHYVNMRDLHVRENWWDALALLITNEWFGAHELRIFFGSFVVHYLISPMGEWTSATAYFILLSMHVGAALVVGWTLWRVLRSQPLAMTAMVVLTYWPTMSQPAIWANNLFFVQPWFLFSLTLASVVLLWRKPIVSAVAASLLGLVTVFSGEAIIPLMLGAFGVLPILTLMITRNPRRSLASALPLVVLIVGLGVYLMCVVTWPSQSALDISRLQSSWDYLLGAKEQFLSLTDPWSARYGGGSVDASGSTLLLVVALVATSVVALFYSRTPRPPRFPRRRVATFLLLGGGLLLSITPWLLGVVTGSRPGPDLRYLYIPSAMLILLVILAVDSLNASSRSALRALGMVGVVGLIATSISVTTFNVRDVWGNQREVDARIWNAIDHYLGPQTRAIVTYHPEHPYLMAPYHSNAVSDFQADWGVAGRIGWKHPEWTRVAVFRDAAVVDGEVVGLHYYDTGTTCLGKPSVAGEVIYITYDYGPEFGDLLTSPLAVTTDVADFLNDRSRIQSRYLITSPDPWAPCDE